LPIEQDGLKLFYSAETVQAFERSEALKVIHGQYGCATRMGARQRLWPIKLRTTGSGHHGSPKCATTCHASATARRCLAVITASTGLQLYYVTLTQQYEIIKTH
jgi:hypothetical protein